MSLVNRILEELSTLVGHPSIAQNGNEELVNYLEVLLRELGFHTKIQQVTHSKEALSNRQFNIIGVIGDPLVDRKIRTGLLLQAHLDTVGPGVPSFWTENDGQPCKVVLKNDEVYGLGIANAKADFLCKVFAAAQFVEKAIKMPIYVVGTCASEAGNLGTRYLLESMALNPQYSLVGAPTDLKIVSEHKSHHVFNVSIQYRVMEKDAKGFNRRVRLAAIGNSNHSAYGGDDQNALIKLFDFIRQAQDNGFELRFKELVGGGQSNQLPVFAEAEFYLTSLQFEDFRQFFSEWTSQGRVESQYQVELGGVGESGVTFFDESVFPCLVDVLSGFKDLSFEYQDQNSERFSPPGTTVNLEKIEPLFNRIDLTFSVRLLPGNSLRELEERVKEKVSRYIRKYPALNVEYHRDYSANEFAVSEKSELLPLSQMILKELKMDSVPAVESFSSEASHFMKAGYDAILFGPGRAEGNTHSPNESVRVEDLEKATRFYEKMIERVCL